jgi:hypothetical protein
MKKRRLVLAAVAGALLAVAVAVPSLAAYAGKAAEGGSVRLYHYTVDTDTAPVPQYLATGASRVRLNYDAKVDPYSITWNLAGTGLEPGIVYSLVNIRWLYADPGIGDPSVGDFWLVDELAYKAANARGILTMKGSSDTLGSTLSPYQDNTIPDPGYYEDGSIYGLDTVWCRFSGAEVWLVPRTEVKTNDGSGWDLGEPFTYVSRYDQDGSAVNPQWWLASLGLPVDTADIDALTYSRLHPPEGPEAAPQAGAPGAAQRATGD